MVCRLVLCEIDMCSPLGIKYILSMDEMEQRGTSLAPLTVRCPRSGISFDSYSLKHSFFSV